MQMWNQNKETSICYLFFESKGHKCFLVLQNYILSTGLFREILVRAMHWVTCAVGAEIWKWLIMFIVAFEAECVLVYLKSFSVCLIMAWGCSSTQTTSLSNTLLILSVEKQKGADLMCVCVNVFVCWERHRWRSFRPSLDSLFTLILNEKLPSKCLN